MDSPGRFEVQLILCDFVSISEGKVFINGGAWTWIDPGIRFGMAAIVRVPWTDANHKTTFELRLLQEDGDPILEQGPAGLQPVAIAGEFEVGRPAGHQPGTAITFPMAFNFDVLPLPAGRWLRWEMLINGVTVDGVTFECRSR